VISLGSSIALLPFLASWCQTERSSSIRIYRICMGRGTSFYPIYVFSLVSHSRFVLTFRLCYLLVELCFYVVDYIFCDPTYCLNITMCAICAYWISCAHVDHLIKSRGSFLS
jgi:hypothetical protein